MAIAPISDLLAPGALGRIPARPELWLVRPGGAAAAKEGAGAAGTCPRPRASGCRRARLAVRRRRALLLMAIAGMVAALAVPVTALGGRPAGGGAGPSAAGGSAVYVVQPGDTLWSIASRLDRGGDPRPLAEALVHETGSSVVVPGERIHVP
ncbi:MAG: LysM peptidoglycan-binding domain-containing protein [Acidimicrobiales bacterium]